MRGKLPESIRARTHQTHFGSSFRDEIQRRWHVYEEAFGPSARSRVVERGYVDREGFWARLTALRDGSDYGTDLIYIMVIACLESWLRVLEHPRPQQVTVPPVWSESRRAREGAADARRSSDSAVAVGHAL
jgi:hypothetical protein